MGCLSGAAQERRSEEIRARARCVGGEPLHRRGAALRVLNRGSKGACCAAAPRWLPSSITPASRTVPALGHLHADWCPPGCSTSTASSGKSLRFSPRAAGQIRAPQQASGTAEFFRFFTTGLSVASWSHPSLPLSSPPPVLTTLASGSILTAVLMVVSSPRRRVVRPVRPARARRVVRRIASCASPPRHRYTAILTHPLPGSSEAGEGGSEACGDLGCDEGELAAV